MTKSRLQSVTSSLRLKIGNLILASAGLKSADAEDRAKAIRGPLRGRGQKPIFLVETGLLRQGPRLRLTIPSDARAEGVQEHIEHLAGARWASSRTPVRPRGPGHRAGGPAGAISSYNIFLTVF